MISIDLWAGEEFRWKEGWQHLGGKGGVVDVRKREPAPYISPRLVELAVKHRSDHITRQLSHACDKSLSTGDVVLQPENQQSTRPI